MGHLKEYTFQNSLLRKSIFTLLLLILTIYEVESRKHHLEVRDDTRPYIALSTFGFYTNGNLDVQLSKVYIENEQADDLFGLTLDKTTIDVMNPYLDAHQNKCILEEPTSMQNTGPILFFQLDLKNLVVNVQCSPQWKNLHIYKDHADMFLQKRQSFSISDSPLMTHRKRRDIEPHEDVQDIPEDILDDSVEEPIEQAVKNTTPSLKLQPPQPAVHAAAAKAVPPLPAVAESNKLSSAEPKAPPTAAGSESNRLPVAPAGTNAAVSDYNKLPIDSDAPQSKPIHEISKLPVESAAIDSQPIYEHPQNNLCRGYHFPLTKTIIDGKNYYNMSFSMFIASLHDEGLYNLYFHACPNYRTVKPVSFNVDIEENNNGNYLSAGEMPLPALYFMMSILFFLSGLFWVFILRKSKHTVYKIHYIMAVLVFLKSLSLMFHSINYHFIQKRGEHVETWAILYYIAHLLKGAVLFITIVLIGTGWTFIKHILSDKDKQIFMIVIPLQVFANVAQIITDESEESDVEFHMWRNIFFFVDLLCCGFILCPIVWSIRHLHEASATDGKAAINLRKLKLFRQFYIMIVCYIYFTRIIVDLLKMTVAFQYAWLDEMFHEMATYVFFVLTGYKFRPTSSHPYFSVPDDDDDDEVEVLTTSGLTEGLHRTKALNRNALPATTIIEGNDEEREILITKRESSHEYD